MLGMEKEPYLMTPGLEHVPELPEGSQFRFRYLNGDKVLVEHPFHAPTTLGDRSAFETPFLDDAAVVLFRELPYLLDTRKLSRPDQLATRPLAGRYSELSHCFSLAMLAKESGGGPADILDALWNDAVKLYCGHQGDDNYWGHNHEDGHDLERPDFFRRAGIIDAFLDAGVLRMKGETLYVGDTLLSIDTLLNEDEATVRATFISNKHHERRMDADKFQYNEEERYLMNLAANRGKADPMRLPRAMAQLSLDSVARRIVRENGEGDQLIFIDQTAAELSSYDYVRNNTEHWTEPMQDLVSDMLNVGERYLFLCGDSAAEAYQLFYPRDYLHTSATLIYKLFEKVAQNDQAMRWFMNTAKSLAEHQKSLALAYDRGENRYHGPQPPGWVKLERIDVDTLPDQLISMDGNIFTIILPQGKVRTINPRVARGKETFPLTELSPEYADFQHAQHQWIGNYKATIVIEDREEAGAIRQAINLINNNWINTLRTRPPMPDSVLRETIKEANKFVLESARPADSSF